MLLGSSAVADGGQIQESYSIYLLPAVQLRVSVAISVPSGQ